MTAAADADTELREAVAHALKAGGSVREVAAFTGMSTNTIQKWGRERGWPTPEQQAERQARRDKVSDFDAQVTAAETMLRHLNVEDE